jgi:hypothetical protein
MRGKTAVSPTLPHPIIAQPGYKQIQLAITDYVTQGHSLVTAVTDALPYQVTMDRKC